MISQNLEIWHIKQYYFLEWLSFVKKQQQQKTCLGINMRELKGNWGFSFLKKKKLAPHNSP